jgi:murein L,D-transpeptidase YafK
LWLCDGTVATKSFNVRLGKGGVGKSREGDGKVPLGSYALGKPRKSKKFGLFIPIAYPTAQQKAQGYTGGGVGIHGPHRSVAWLGRLVNTFDTTDGCVGLATDDETREVANWVNEHRAAMTSIE